MRWTTVGAGAVIAALATTPGATASATAGWSRTTTEVCSRTFGSVQDLPAVTYGNRFMAAIGRAGGFAAGCYGDFPVVRVLRSQGLTGTKWTWVSSQSGFGYTYSTYRDGRGRTVEIAVLLGDREPGGWHAVDGIRAEGSRGAFSRYADRRLAAWRAGDTDAMARLARPGAVATLSGSAGADSAWRQTAVRYGDGQTWVEYADPAGAVLSVRLNQAGAIAGRPRSVVQVVLP